VIDVPNKRSADLVRQITMAFAEVKYPGSDHLVAGHSLEALEIAGFLGERPWQDLRLDELVYNHASIFFMTPEAIRSYLPAYLNASVLHYREADQIPDSIMFLLSPPAAGDLNGKARFRARFAPLTDAQLNAIRAFLQYLHDEHAEDYPTEDNGDEALKLLKLWAGGPELENKNG